MALAYAAHAIRVRAATRAEEALFVLFSVFDGQIIFFVKLRNGAPIPIDPKYIFGDKPQPPVDPPFLHRYRLVDSPGGDTTNEQTVLQPLTDRMLSGTSHCRFFPLLVDDKPITVADYKALRDRSAVDADRTIGVSHLYGFVNNTKPDAIAEVHFFTHSWSEGPIFLNTVDFNSTGKGHDNFDKDARSKDLKSTHNPIIVAGFRNKFTTGGFSALWGCDADPITRAYIDTARKSKVEPLRIDFVPPRNASPDDTRLLTREFQRVFKGFWKIERRKGEVALFATVTRSQFADAIKTRVVGQRYNKSLARASGCPVFGALPGTWSNYDDVARVAQRASALTHIIQGREDDRDNPSSEPLDMKPLLSFYRDNLPGGVTFNMSDFTVLPDLPPAFSLAFQRGFAKHSPDG